MMIIVIIRVDFTNLKYYTDLMIYNYNDKNSIHVKFVLHKIIKTIRLYFSGRPKILYAFSFKLTYINAKN